jgi:hypothetical protein
MLLKLVVFGCSSEFLSLLFADHHEIIRNFYIFDMLVFHMAKLRVICATKEPVFNIFKNMFSSLLRTIAMICAFHDIHCPFKYRVRVITVTSAILRIIVSFSS